MSWKHWIPLLGLGLTACGGTNKAPLERVEQLDLERYQGIGYEIAKFPNRFQDQCVAATRADYSLLADGTVEVVNRCRRSNGEEEAVRGRARRPDPERPAALEVRFAPVWLSWLPVVWGDYRVLALDEAYTSALIGERSRQFLWILSRTPTLAQTRVDELLEEAERQGFPVDRIDFTLQDEP